MIFKSKNFSLYFKSKKIYEIFNRTFNYTPLIVASSIGYTEIVKLLLSQSGIEINCKDILTETNS